MNVSILGTEYDIRFSIPKHDKRLEECDGYCDFSAKIIVILKKIDKKGNIHDFQAYQRKVLRHEITHAFLYESGLAHNSLCIDGTWAMNEEMVDWIAIQGQKLHKAWAEVGALD